MSAKRRDARDDAQNMTQVETDAFWALTREAFERGVERVSFSPRGRSMRPTLRGGRDVVYLTPPTASIEKYDLAFYRRTNGTLVLHRVVALERDGTLTCCGDNQTRLERGITREQVFAVVQAFKRGRRTFDCKRSRVYRLYSRVWVAIRPFRAPLRLSRRVRRKFKRLFSGRTV